MQLFAQLTKVDVEKREVTGRAAQEVRDRASEVFDYETSKPHFEQWSGEIAKATDGKSLGNVRAMHGATAAGKLTALTFDDTEKAVDIVAKIVDDAEWEKVQEGVYTGFSIGGKYAKRWKDAADPTLTRYTATPHEISLVDLPCIPTATFQLIKADGAAEAHAFKIAERSDTSAKEGESKYGNVKFADPTNKKYPIDTVAHIRAAWNYINKSKNAAKYSAADVKSIKARIVAAWKSKIDKDGPPSAEKLAKSMYDVARLADLLQSIKYMAECAASERIAEGDDSTQPEALEAWLKDGVELLRDMIDEEGAELTGETDDPDTEDMTMAAKIDELAKLLAEHKDLTAEQIAETLRTGQVPAPVQKTVGADDLSKAIDAGLSKVTELVTEKLTALDQRLAKIEAQPAPAKTTLRSVEKSTEMAGADGNGEQADPNDPIALMKAAQRAPKLMAGR